MRILQLLFAGTRQRISLKLDGLGWFRDRSRDTSTGMKSSKQVDDRAGQEVNRPVFRSMFVLATFRTEWIGSRDYNVAVSTK